MSADGTQMNADDRDGEESLVNPESGVSGLRPVNGAARILIVDDSPENRLLLASQLRTDGYEILQAGNGSEGIRLAREKRPDLILLDVMMPGIDGFEVSRRLKGDGATSGIPIVIVTALREVEYRIQGIEVGADEFLSRPHHREELLVRVRSLIKLKRTRERLEEERNKLAAILVQSSDAIITTDESGHVSLFNQSAEMLIGLAARVVIGRSIEEVPELAPLRPLFAAARRESAAQEIEIQGGRTLYASVSPIQGVGYVAVMQDVTEIKRAEVRRLEYERRQRALVKETFARYMGSRLADHVLSHDPDVLNRRERRRAVVMFADLRDSTRLIVQVDPDRVIDMLNTFFSQITDIVHEFNGTIFDLAGDELMVGFNVPFDQADAAYRAFLTGLSMQLQFDRLRREWRGELETTLGLGIGIDEGDVIVGNVGAQGRRMNFAMVGEAVNTAHRLVDIAGDGEIVMSQAIYEGIGDRAPSFIRLEAMGEVALEGKLAPQRLYRARVRRTAVSRNP